MNPAIALGGALALIVALAGAYISGRSDGAAIEKAAQARVEKAIEAERRQREAKVDAVGAGAAEASQVREAGLREVYHESERVVERPVYRNVCVDADGVRLLDAAAAIASGADPGEHAGAAAAVAQGPPAP